MPEVKRPVKPIEVNYLCDKCEHGMMKQSEAADKDSGETPHECVICGHKQIFKWVSYPHVEYIDEQEEV